MKKQGKDTIDPLNVDVVDFAGTRQPVPTVDADPGQQYADENRRFANVTTVTQTPGGRLWYGFSGGGEGESHLNYGMVVFSDDDEYMVAERHDGSLVLFNRDFKQSILECESGDQGQTWSPWQVNGIPNACSRLVLMNQSVSEDCGCTWSPMRPNGLHGIEPGVIRSPNGNQLLMFIRDFSSARTYNSLYAISNDDGNNWSQPRRLPAGLTGDRHSPCYAEDGRLLVLMRDTLSNGTSPTNQHFIAWVGRYENERNRLQRYYPAEQIDAAHIGEDRS